MAEPLKNMYDDAFFAKLNAALKKAWRKFPERQFMDLVLDSKWEDRELKERIRHVAVALREVLPKNYAEAVEILKKASPAISGLLHVSFPDFVALYGLEEYEISVAALEYFTRFSTSEFAVRPFILQYEERMMHQMLAWSKHENFHVRRLASEGCRPRLPWAMALPAFKQDPSAILPILENLKNDPEAYVRRSVANNLNDISKDHPDRVLEIAAAWKGKSKETDGIVKHALRTLLKKGNTQALELFGFGKTAGLAVEKLRLESEKIPVGGALLFSFTLRNQSKTEALCRVEYVIDYLKSNGRHSQKVFQITENTFPAGSSTPFSRKQSFRNMTTRKHNPGNHVLRILVNGKEMGRADFEVTDGAAAAGKRGNS